nr:hypothetical protein [uncultured Flavobacterium sp.]
MSFSKLIFLFLVVSQFSFGQNNSEIPKNFSKVEGLEYIGKITFYFDNKTQTVLALKNGKVEWKVNAKDVCGKSYAKKSKMKYIGIRGKYLEVVYKHRRVNIEVETGKATCKIKEGRIPIY